ncbi:hypothetical protein D3OALGB2SA_3565 [Olavius algarvensis associated proteobacterium Delta 3]|nr:hypothetical protein D3OALGB2SA_3565 [Olavius algarvensis associated proteobacterium Delta 3]
MSDVIAIVVVINMFRLQKYGNDNRRDAGGAKELCGEPLIVK